MKKATKTQRTTWTVSQPGPMATQIMELCSKCGHEDLQKKCFFWSEDGVVTCLCALVKSLCFVLFSYIPAFPKANPSMRAVTIMVGWTPKTLRESLYLQSEDPGKSLPPPSKMYGGNPGYFFLFPPSSMPQVWEMHNSVRKLNSEWNCSFSVRGLG